MVVLAVLGALVLALVSWAALREAQRLPGSFPATGRRNAPSPGPGSGVGAGDGATTSPAVNGQAVPLGARTHVVGDATVADADTAEALAAAAALWHVLVDAERGLTPTVPRPGDGGYPRQGETPV